MKNQIRIEISGGVVTTIVTNFECELQIVDHDNISGCASEDEIRSIFEIEKLDGVYPVTGVFTEEKEIERIIEKHLRNQE
jgi:hypothetical protein